jgi:hypothetical protein
MDELGLFTAALGLSGPWRGVREKPGEAMRSGDTDPSVGPT